MEICLAMTIANLRLSLLLMEGRTACLPSERRELRNGFKRAVKNLWQAVVQDLLYFSGKLEPINCRAFWNHQVAESASKEQRRKFTKEFRVLCTF
jgi:hypothetical protein